LYKNNTRFEVILKFKIKAIKATCKYNVKPDIAVPFKYTHTKKVM